MNPKFALLVLLALFSSATLTAAEDILSPGPPALTRSAARQIGDFLEFAVGASFTLEERTLLERAQVESWKQSTPKQREDSLKIAQMQQAIAAMSDTDRAEVRRKIQPQIIATLRQNPEDALARFLLTAANHTSNNATNAAMPRELVGEWMSMRTSTVNYVNQATGSFAPPSGDGSHYRFFPDGRFEYTGLIQSSMYNCTMTITPFEKGTVRFEGSTIHFDSTGGTLASKDNCNRQYNYEKPIAANTRAYTWRLLRDDYGVKFCIVAPGVKESCAYKK